MDESVISFVKGELSKQTIVYHTQKIINKYFELKFDGDKCGLFLSLLIFMAFIVSRKTTRNKDNK